LAWLDERARRLLAGEPVESVLAAQERHAGAPCRVACPVLALFGAADPLVPVPQSIAAFAANLPPLPGDPHGIAVFPAGDHGLFIANPQTRPYRAPSSSRPDSYRCSPASCASSSPTIPRRTEFVSA
jgi:pimeloyl-ACP methyl ester carboxylesterase